MNSEQNAVKKDLNITPKRLLALKYLADKPNGVYVCGLADAILTSEWRREHKTGFSAQQATRSGAGYAIPLINAGLVRKQRTDYGWGMVFLTDAGHKVIAAHDAANNPANQPLDAVLARCVEN